MIYLYGSGKARSRISFFILSILLSFPLFPEAQESRSHSREDLRTAFVNDLAVLASDSLEGRRSGTPGEKKAADFISGRFSELGLDPKGTDSNSFIQQFKSTPYLYAGFNTKLVIDDREYRKYDDFGMTRFTGSGTFEGAVVNAGRGIYLPGAGIDDYKEKDDLNGKAVLIDLSIPKGISKKDSLLKFLLPKKRIGDAVSRGARAVIFWNPDRPSYKIFDFQHPDTSSVPVIYVSLDVAEHIIKNPASDISLTVVLNQTAESYSNVIGYLDNHAESTIIIGGHYDHMGRGKKGQIRYGADDNASGTAMVMELAGYLKDHPDPKNNYLFIAFSGEEEGLLGSEWFAAHPTIDLGKVNFMMNFDMVGRLGCEGNMIYAIGTKSSPDWKKIYKSARPDAFRVRNMRGAGFFSDHTAFYKHGIPVAYFTTGFHYDYHTPDDCKERINYDGMADIALYLQEFLTSAVSHDKIRYQKINGWHQFNANMHYILEELDYMMTVGLEGAE